MATITFDSLGYAKKLEAAGFTREQAEVQANALREVIDERLVTRDYLDTRLKELEYRLTIRLGAMLAASIAMVAALDKLL